MIIILHPEDLPDDYKGDKKNPPFDIFIPRFVTILKLEDVVIYRYEEETLILKGPDISDADSDKTMD